MGRRVVVGGSVLVLVVAAVFWGSKPAPTALQRGDALEASGASPREEPLPSRWSQPISHPSGTKRLSGRVLGLDGGVPGAVVTALANHGDEVLSDLECHCDNHCGRTLLQCGCPEAAGQLVDLVAQRTGEATPLARATTDGEGRFVLEGLDDTELAVWADAPGGVALRQGVHAADEPLELALEAGRTIVGTVKRQEGAPLEGALVTAIYERHSRFFETRTDAAGSFRLGPMPNGAYAMVVSAAGLLPETEQARDGANEPLDFTLSVPRALAGLVLEGGRPAAGATVKLDGMHRKRSVTADGAGAFRFERLRPGRYSLEASGSRGRARGAQVVPAQADRLDVALELVGGVEVRGVVVDEAGQPVPEASVSVSEERDWRTVTADAQGRFLIEAVVPGTHWFSATKKGFLDLESFTAKVLAGDEVSKLTLRRSAALAGRVVDPNGVVVSAYSIAASPVDGGVESESATSRDGGFWLDVPEGAYTLAVTADGFAPGTFAAVAPARELRLQLRPQASVHGRVLGEAGEGLVGYTVSVTTPEGRRGDSATTDERGEFEAKGLGRGEHHLSAALVERASTSVAVVVPPVTVSLEEGRRAEVVLRAAKGASVDGEVVDGAGASVKGATVYLSTEERREGRRADSAVTMLRVATGDRGRFAFHGLAPGAYRLLAYHQQATVELPVTAPAARLTVRLEEGTTISGRVVGEDGKPLKEFSINSERREAEDGQFKVPYTTGAQLQVAFDSPGYAQRIMTIAVKDGANPLGDVRLDRGHLLEGVVVDATTKAPIENALVDVGLPESDAAASPNVSLDEHRGAVRTDVQGRFRLRRDAASTLVYVVHAEHVPLRKQVSASDRTVELAMSSGGQLEVRVVRPSGAPSTARLRVWGAGPGGRVLGFTPGSAGAWAARGLEPGAWLIQAVGQDVVVRSVQVTVGLEPQTVTMTEATDGVVVTVLGLDAEQATLIAGAVPTPLSLEVLKGLRTAEVATPTSEGRFEHVRAGRWSLLLVRRGSDRRQFEAAVVPADVADAPLTLTVPSGGWQPFPTP